ncbi:MAG: nucleoside hydrolase [Chloroflexi bacterium]|nr:nucleoside hydrolase [Chloroflexota bacterium]
MPRRRLVAGVLAVILAGCGTGVPTTGSPSASSTPTVPPSLPEPSGSVTMLVDTDVAPDDLVAIAFLVSAPQVSIAAITVSGTGEAHCDPGVAIVLGLLERLDAPQIPVACGRELPLALDHAFPDLFRDNADHAAGLELPDTARQPTSGDAVELIHATVRGADGPLRVLTLGPLTNLAEAFQRDPSLAAELESVYVMGGAVDVPGNVAGSPDAPTDNTSAEWNMYVDPAAVAVVLDAGAPVFLVSLDGINRVPVTPAFAERVRASANGPGLRVLAELFAANPFMTSGDYYLWDTVAAITAAGYHIGQFTEAHLTVDVGEGPTSGATRRGDGEPNATFLSDAEPSTVEQLVIGVLNRE